MSSYEHDIAILDFWTRCYLNSLWEEQVKECIHNDIETGKFDTDAEYDIIENTAFTEPFWGIVVNK